VIPQAIEDDPEAELIMPMEASNLQKGCSGILKKDIIHLYINQDDPSKLWIGIKNLEKGRDIENYVTLLDEDNPEVAKKLNPVAPVQYISELSTATGAAAEFQKACKAGGATKSAVMTVQSQKGANSQNAVRVTATNGQVSKSFNFGGISWNAKMPISYSQKFLIKGNIGPVHKCCSMSRNVRLYCEGEKPLRISLTTGSFGQLDIYLVPHKH
jgi:hypothetical protein